MKTNRYYLLLPVALAGLLALCATAGDGKPLKLPPSHVEEVNFTNMTFTIKFNQTNLVVRITPDTRFILGGKPAISKDLETADHVHGALRQPASGIPEAVRIHIQKRAPK
jgi:hypothetical protein